MFWLSVSSAGFLVAVGLVVVLARSQTARWERGRRAVRAARRRPLRRRIGHGAAPGAAADAGPLPGVPALPETGVRDTVRRPDRPRRRGRPARRVRQAASAEAHPIRSLHLPGHRRRQRSGTPAP